MRARDVAFSFIERVDEAASLDVLRDMVLDAVRRFGMSSFLAGGVPAPGEPADSYVVLNGWPQEWYQRYATRRYFEIDPVIARMTASTKPFAWSDVRFDKERQPEAARVFGEANEFGLGNGITVPIFSRTGYSGGVTFGTDRLDLDPESRGALHLIAIYAHHRASEMVSGSGNRAAELAMKLAPREVECLRWTAAGKTSWEIGEILHLSSKTVDHYLATACAKLDASTRAQAVAVVVRAKLL